MAKRRTSGRDAEPDGAKAVRTRRRILEAAAEVLAEKGFAGTRLIDIAEVAEVQAPAIYYYYESREALIEAVVMEGTRNATIQVEIILGELTDADPVARLLAAVEGHLRVAMHGSAFTLASIRNSGQLPDDMRARKQVEETKYGRIWRGLVADVADAGLLRADLNPVAAQMLIIGAMNWSPEWWTPKLASLDEVVDTAKALITGGLLTAKNDQPALTPSR
ncbi:TetR family transcriptional regulator [Rhodococcus sp. ACS1]|uniref:TetR/AcrR family transcriptional regulator n=1 Tax=Rhodococcus sp. ACS1 TaxID=2028570 RepID=UPI000BB0F6C8|nr:TetR/AcrR family transcriptional regulator [Rhodococcus sp. ACS1]PBC35341.1 TetR family transcriptional regulator [Rhodococcus sp. ACS1]